MTDEIQRFIALLQASDTLIEQATKDDVAEVARVLALHVAHYRRRYGDVSIEESLEMLRTEKISDEMAKVLADGFGVLVEVLKARAVKRSQCGWNLSVNRCASASRSDDMRCSRIARFSRPVSFPWDAERLNHTYACK